ncbi:DUF1824 family protein [Synechococcus sp. A15-60]|uniref:DUF1824 family protein n=1 Tax=Synechococcus sp. A15-60 TaxID=1050655 RepID=UPI001645F419|nr:DUF1824 family protein [Synechococcus sp. A15-60]
MSRSPVQCLKDLERLRSAPDLSAEVASALRGELGEVLAGTSWCTVGVMAQSAEQALQTLRSLETALAWSPLEVVEGTDQNGPVFLKANQQMGTVRVRIEHGLGEGILITGHHNDEGQISSTWGPLPLDFFEASTQAKPISTL